MSYMHEQYDNGHRDSAGDRGDLVPIQCWHGLMPTVREAVHGVTRYQAMRALRLVLP
jgi:hypothetical protein